MRIGVYEEFYNMLEPVRASAHRLGIAAEHMHCGAEFSKTASGCIFIHGTDGAWRDLTIRPLEQGPCVLIRASSIGYRPPPEPWASEDRCAFHLVPPATDLTDSDWDELIRRLSVVVSWKELVACEFPSPLRRYFVDEESHAKEDLMALSIYCQGFLVMYAAKHSLEVSDSVNLEGSVSHALEAMGWLSLPSEVRREVGKNAGRFDFRRWWSEDALRECGILGGSGSFSSDGWAAALVEGLVSLVSDSEGDEPALAGAVADVFLQVRNDLEKSPQSSGASGTLGPAGRRFQSLNAAC